MTVGLDQEPDVVETAAEPAAPDAATAAPEATDAHGFRIRLTNFEGPFDLLLQLISQHRLDVTEVALHQVTDEFIAYTKSLGDTYSLDEVTAFLVVAATLLDLKAARLLPSGQVDNDDDLALLEIRDLLFARLLQYRAFTELVAECTAPIEIVARFLGVLELYRSKAVLFEQSEPLGPLQVSWTGERPAQDDLEKAVDYT